MKLHYDFVNGNTLTFDVSYIEMDIITKEYISPLNKGEWLTLTRNEGSKKEFHSINPANVIRVTVTNQ